MKTTWPNYMLSMRHSLQIERHCQKVESKIILKVYSMEKINQNKQKWLY